MPDLSVYYAIQAAMFFWIAYREKRSLTSSDCDDEPEIFAVQVYPSQAGEHQW